MSEQSDVIAFLSSPAAFDGRGDIEIIETHGAIVFLCGNTALKLKRAVKYDYMDLSTVELRRLMLLREIELNAPQAPMIYRDVLPITKEDSGLALGGQGPTLDWVLRMWRFPAENEFEYIAARDELDDELAAATGAAVAAYHEAMPVIRREGDGLIKDILAELERVFAEFPEAAGTEQVGSWLTDVGTAFASAQPILAERGLDGHVRRAHGDLHLRNLVLIDGAPVLFDALEFDEELGTCDVLYDIAFLIMDLCHKGMAQQACRVLDTWLSEARGNEDAGLEALPLFLSVRAAIRAMVLLQTDAARKAPGASSEEIGAYLDLAREVLKPKQPVLVAVGGYSGSGKSVIAAKLAPTLGPMPGAVIVSSDLERKAGLPKQIHLPEAAYSEGRRGAVYQAMFERAETLLSAGHSVLLDATFINTTWRDEAANLAERAGVPFHGLWLDASEEILETRLRMRETGASDADVTVLRKQLQAPLGAMAWQRIDASKPVAEVLESAQSYLCEYHDSLQTAS
ncbi:MAG: AAA family ATPase [Paracoccaceae bacterium]|nr:AAA family ATPase [Paracoccaceae bacterium]